MSFFCIKEINFVSSRHLIDSSFITKYMNSQDGKITFLQRPYLFNKKRSFNRKLTNLIF